MKNRLEMLEKQLEEEKEKQVESIQAEADKKSRRRHAETNTGSFQKNTLKVFNIKFNIDDQIYSIS